MRFQYVFFIDLIWFTHYHFIVIQGFKITTIFM